MTGIEKIRLAVKVLSTISNDEWRKIEEAISAQDEWRKIEEAISTQTKSKEDKKQISFAEKEKKVTEVLKMLGIPSHIKGYEYTRRAVLLIIDDSEYISSMTKLLYPTLATEFETTSSRVERAIRHAAEIAWERGNIEIQEKIFGYSVSPGKGKPTNSELLACIADYVKMYVL